MEVYPHTKLDGNRKKFLWTYGRTDGRTDGWTHLSSNLLGHRRGDDLKMGRNHYCTVERDSFNVAAVNTAAMTTCARMLLCRHFLHLYILNAVKCPHVRTYLRNGGEA